MAAPLAKKRGRNIPPCRRYAVSRGGSSKMGGETRVSGGLGRIPLRRSFAGGPPALHDRSEGATLTRRRSCAGEAAGGPDTAPQALRCDDSHSCSLHSPRALGMRWAPTRRYGPGVPWPPGKKFELLHTGIRSTPFEPASSSRRRCSDEEPEI